MKPSTKARRALLGTVLAGSTLLATGCTSGGSSLASMNPFSSTPPSSTQNEPNAAAKLTDSIASTAGGARSQLSTMGSTVKSAWGKSTSAVAGMFGGNKEGEEELLDPDPLRLDNKPKNVGPEVFVANGQLWESTGNYSKAMESYVKALESEPNNPPALTSIARLHFRQGNHQKAVEFFQKAISQSPKDAGLHNDLGLTLSKLGNHAAAAQSLQTALQIAPGTSRYANNLASVMFEAGDAASAYQVLSANNKPAVAHFNMAYLHFKTGQMNEARGHLDQAIRFEPQAADDSAVKRAVDRSRDMLAQINGSMSPVAQAVPQATIAALPGNTPIQQTSQSATPGSLPNVAPAGSPAADPTAAPSWSTAPPAVTPTAPAAPSPGSEKPSVPFTMPGGFQLPSGQ